MLSANHLWYEYVSMRLKHTHKPMVYSFGQRTTNNGCLVVDEKKLKGLVFEAYDKINKLSTNVNPTKGNNQNLIDPTGAIFEIATLHRFNKKSWSNSEEMRSKQKSLMNIIGNLQQSIIGTLPGWKSHPTGTSSPDIEGEITLNGKHLKIIGEVKNKHNTFNGGSKDSAIKKMNEFLVDERYKSSVPIIVQIVKPSYSKNGELLQLWSNSEGVRILSGRIFYALAANPIINCDIFDKSPKANDSKQMFKDLNTIHSFDCINEYIFYFLEEITNKEFDFSILDYIGNQNM
jgi:hypothetical protein